MVGVTGLEPTASTTTNMMQAI